MIIWTEMEVRNKKSYYGERAIYFTSEQEALTQEL